MRSHGLGMVLACAWCCLVACGDGDESSGGAGGGAGTAGASGSSAGSAAGASGGSGVNAGSSAGASGSGGGSAGGTAVATPREHAVESCKTDCVRLSEATGCGVNGKLDECVELCVKRVPSLPEACIDEWNAYYDCLAKDTLICNPHEIIRHADEACFTELTWMVDCSFNGGVACAGADAAGHCPVVACACTDGVKMRSGYAGKGADCTCWDAATCTASYCQ